MHDLFIHRMISIHKEFGVGEFYSGYAQFLHKMLVDEGSGGPTVDEHFEREGGVSGYKDGGMQV